MLLGCGLVGGIMRNNGRFTAAEEMLAMSGGELFQLTDQTSLHRNIEFPAHRHASLYNASSMELVVKKFLLDKGIEIHLITRIDDVELQDGRIKAVTGKTREEKVRVEGDVFIDATGTAGPPAQCTKYGNGCAMCILRCPSFGGRASLAAKCGVTEMIGRKGEPRRRHERLLRAVQRNAFPGGRRYARTDGGGGRSCPRGPAIGWQTHHQRPVSSTPSRNSATTSFFSTRATPN